MDNYKKNSLLYKGKAKEMFSTNKPNTLWVHYMDQVTALNGKKKVKFANKGKIDCNISSFIFNDLTQHGIKNHFIKKIDDNNQLVKKVNIIPLETVIRNFASGSIQKRFNLLYLTKFKKPIIEFYYKSDKLDDPFINDSEIQTLEIANKDQLTLMKTYILKINKRLSKIFSEMNISLIDFKVEFGIDENNKLILADEISPDSCRLVDKKTKKSLDKDVFRKESGSLTKAYQEILKRLKEVEIA